MSVKKAFSLFIILCVALSAEDNRGGLAGPIPLRIISPTRVLFYQLNPEKAETLGKGNWGFRFEFSESNTNQPVKAPAREFEINVNMELSRFNLGLKRGLTDSTDIGVELPLMFMHGGFLDNFIKSTEDFFLSPKPRRYFEAYEQFGFRQNGFDYRLSRNGVTFLDGEDGLFGIGDAALSLKQRIVEQGGVNPSISLRAALKFPTGDKNDAFGSGRIDAAVGLAADWVLKKWGVNLNVNTTFPFGTEPVNSGLDTQPTIGGHVEIEYRTSGKYSWHLQFAATNSPFTLDVNRGPSDLLADDADPITGAIMQITPAFAWRPRPHMRLMLGVVEDFLSSENAAADFTFFLAFDYLLRKR
ncbi:MAG: DUF3187 family protein [Planctomycetota bacterium]|jgi:hypothetical protein|nr:DUF3187 family protein [Planctomycetota bacterium]MDP7251568.1 DUF3187 family protein [Planctomycetota bacterium]